MNSTEEIVVLITAPKEAEAVKIAKALVEKRLAACVNVISDIRSIYRWQGKIEDDTEMLLIIKTKKGLFDALAAEVKEIHSYTVPEIIALPIVQGQADYLKWLSESTCGGKELKQDKT